MFARLIEQQGGDPTCLEDPSRLPGCEEVEIVTAATSGQLTYRDVREVGRAVSALGGGRVHLEDEIDPAVGVVCLRRAGDEVEVADELFAIHHRCGKGLESARRHVERSFALSAPGPVSPLVLAAPES